MTGVVVVSHCFQFPSLLLTHWSTITLPCCAVSAESRIERFRSRGYPSPVLEDCELFCISFTDYSIILHIWLLFPALTQLLCHVTVIRWHAFAL
jgi:hypothetical protein